MGDTREIEEIPNTRGNHKVSPTHSPSSIEHNNGGLYAIIDSKAEAIVGPIMIAKHEAQAIRNFCDVADDDRGWVAKHPEDYSLYRLGWLTTDNMIVAEHQLVITGSSYAASKTRGE